MIGTAISTRYAEGLLKVAIRNNKVTKVEEDLFDFINNIWQNKNVRNFFTHPRLVFEVKKQLLESLVKDNYDPLTVEFLLYLIKKNRINEIVPITYRFDELNDKYQGVLKVDVISTYPPSADFLDELKKRLEVTTNRKVKFNVKVEPAIILGIKVKMGDLVVENSLDHKLEDFLNKIEFRR